MPGLWSEIKDVLEYARVMTPEGEILTLGPKELKMDYRTSCIPAMGYTVLDACFRLKREIGMRLRRI